MPSHGAGKRKESSNAAQVGRDAAADLFNLAFLFGLVVLFFLDVVLRGQIFFAGDIMNVYTPWQKYNQEALMSGRMPLWTDDFFAGFPLFAESQGALFYPPTRFVYWLSPLVHAFSFDVLLHFLLAGWFQYFLARTLRLPPAAALLSAVAFAFSGLFLSLPINFTIFRSIVWIPCIFMFMTMAARRGSLVFPLLAAVAMVLQMMAGSLQVTGITVLALVPYTLFLVVSPGEGKQPGLVPLLQLILMIMLAVGLYAFQLFPTLELGRYAWRGTEGGYDVAASFSFPPLHFVDVLFPTFFGLWLDRSLLPVSPPTANYFPYIGLAPLLLVPLALGSRRRGVFIMLILVVLFLALAVGQYGLLYPLIYKTVPFFDKFRGPDRFWMIAVFAGTLLAGYGLDRAVSGIESNKRVASTAGAGLIAVALLLAVLFILGAIYTPFVRSVWVGAVNALVRPFFNPSHPPFDPGILERWRIHLLYAMLHGLVVLLCFHYAFALFGQKGKGGMLAGTLILITAADLYAMSFQVPALHTTTPSFFTNPPRSAQVLRRDGEPNRFYSFGGMDYARSIFHFRDEDDITLWYNGGGSDDIGDYLALREALFPNIAMHWNLTSARGFASLFLRRSLRVEESANLQLQALIEGVDREILAQGGYPGADMSPEEWADRTLVIDLLACRYVITPHKFIPTERFSLVDDGPMLVYRNRKALQRAWVARPERVMQEPRDVFERLERCEIDPTRTLILDPLPDSPRVFDRGAEGTASAKIKLWESAAGASARGGAIADEQVLVEVSSPQPAYLVLADTFYPGWFAEVDGQPIGTIYRAFGHLRAIEIPAGDHLVRFYYRPESFTKGKWLSIVTVGTFILLLLAQLAFFTAPKSREGDTDEQHNRR